MESEKGLQLEPIGDRFIARIVGVGEVASFSSDAMGNEVPIYKPMVGIRHVDRDRATNRLKNEAEMEEWDPRELVEKWADVARGYQETHPIIRERDHVVAQVVGECRNPRYSDPGFGDIVLLPVKYAIFWSGFWRTAARTCSRDTILCVDATGNTWLEIPRASDLVIMRFSDLAGKCLARIAVLEDIVPA
jgi:hypothetical protein